MKHTYNIQRHKDFINLKHKIQSAHKLTLLDALENVVNKYTEQYSDGKELLQLITEQRRKIDPFFGIITNEDETLTAYHRATCGAH